MADSWISSILVVCKRTYRNFESREFIFASTLITLVSFVSIVITLQGWRTRISAFDMLPYIYGIRDLLKTGTVLQSGDIGSYGSFSAPGTIWLMLPGAILFKDPRLIEYFGAALLHVFALTGVYLVARSYFNTRCAAFSVLLYGMSASALFFAGSLWPIGRPDFYIWVVYLTSRWVARRDSRFLAAALALWGFGMYVDMAILPLFFLFPVAWIYYRSPVRLRSLLAAAVVVLLIWLPYLRFEFPRGFADVRSQIFLQSIFPGNYREAWCNPDLIWQKFSDTSIVSQPEAITNQPEGLLAQLLRLGRVTWNNALTNPDPYPLVPAASFILLLFTLAGLLFLSVPGFISNGGGTRNQPHFLIRYFKYIAIGMFLLGLVILGFVFAYLWIFRDGATPGNRLSFIIKLNVLMAACGLALLAEPWIIGRANDLLFRMRVNIQTLERVEQTRLLVFSLIIPWFILLLVAEPDKPERFMWLWPVQSIFLAAFFTNVLPQFHIPRAAIRSVMILVIGIVVINSFSVARIVSWKQIGWSGPDSDETKVVDYLARLLQLEGKNQAAVGYRVFSYPFMVDYHILSPIYKAGAEIDLLLLARHGITNTDQCAEGIAITDEYRIVEKSPKTWPGSPDGFFGLDSDGHFHLIYEVGNFQLLEHD